MQSHGVAHVNHGLDVALAVYPVRQEHAGRAVHGQQVGIGGQCVLLQGVLFCIAAPLRIVILHEGDRITAIGPAVGVAADQGPAAIVLLPKATPVVVVDGIADGIAELEVEGGTGLARCVYPVLDGVGVVPAFAYAVLGLGVFVV